MLDRIALALIFTLALARPATAQAAAPATRPADIHVLMVDDEDVLYRTGTRRHAHQAKRHPDNPLVCAEENPWDRFIAFNSCYRDPQTGKVQIWFQSWNGGRDPDKAKRCNVNYAESDDGIHFTKPKLDLFDFAGVKGTNIVLIGEGGYGDRYGAAVVVRPDEPDPARKYKMLYYDWFKHADGPESSSWMAAFSPDGIHWTKAKENPILNTSYGQRGRQPPLQGQSPYLETIHAKTGKTRKEWDIPLSMSDATDAIWDESHQAYIAFAKVWLQSPLGGFAWKHAMGRSESKDFITWSTPQVVLAPDEHDPKHLEFHTTPTFRYKGRYFALTELLVARSELVPGSKSDFMEIELMLSRDGFHWERPFRGERFLNPKDGEVFSSGSVFTNATPVILEDEIRFYYGGYSSGFEKPSGPGEKNNRSGIGMASIPLDRFAGIRPMPETRHPTLKEPLKNIGQITLKPLDLTGRSELLVNADASAGSVRIEVLDELGYRLRGYAREDAAPMTSDSLRHIAAWKDKKLGDLPPGKYLLRVHLDNAEVFAATIR